MTAEIFLRSPFSLNAKVSGGRQSSRSWMKRGKDALDGGIVNNAVSSVRFKFTVLSGLIAAGCFRFPILSKMERQHDQALAGVDHRIDGHAIPDEQGR